MPAAWAVPDAKAMADALAEVEEEEVDEEETAETADEDAEAEAEADAAVEGMGDDELPVGSPNCQPWTIVCDCCGSPQVCRQAGRVAAGRQELGAD